MGYMRDSSGVRLDSMPLAARSLAARSPRARLSQPAAETVLATFASGHGWTSGGGWGAVNFNDTTDNGWANQVYTGTTNTTGAGNFALRTGLTAFDVTGKLFKLLVKVSDPTKVSEIGLFVSDSSGLTNSAKMIAYLGGGQTLLPDRWTVLTFTLDGATVTATPPVYTAINTLQLRIGASAGSSVTVKYGGLSMMSRPAAYPNGVVSFTFDDGFASHYTYAREVMNRYRYRGSLFPITTKIDTAGYLTSAQLDEMAQLNGWEVGGHATTLAIHQAGLTALDGDALEAELNAIKGWLQDRGYGGDLFAYPVGAYNAPVVAAIEKRFAAARSTDGSVKETPYPGTSSRLRSLPVTSAMTPATVQTAIDRAYTNGNHLILTVHDLVASGATGFAWPQASFAQVVDYCATKGIPVRALGDVLTAA